MNRNGKLSLPIHEIQAGFRAAFQRGPVVVTAPTGSGKSTCVPVWCAEFGRVLVVEPRRVACRSLARFVARQQGCAVGEWVGYAVRHEDHLNPDTAVAFVTPGVALRMLAEGDVARFATIMVDEFHERSVENDLVLALALDRGDKRLVVLSATVEAAPIATYIGGERLHASGEMYPVEVQYVGRNLLPTPRGLEDRVADAVQRVRERPGDILVFLPGKGEIASCGDRLQRERDLEVLPLHGELPPEQQDRAFEPGQRRRVILATNVAETSVTLPGIGVVIDSGLVRQKQYRDGREVLALGPIAEDSAEQRRGRAGRLQPGVCLRLWSQEGRLEKRTSPEIHRCSLASLVLMVAACGRRVEDLRFLDPPREYAVRAAEEELQRLAALDENWRLTDRGRQMARLPVDPFHAALLLASWQTGAVQEMVDLVASLAQGRPLFRPVSGEEAEAVREARKPLLQGRCDGEARIRWLREGEPERQKLNREALDEGRQIARQLRERLALPEPPPGPFDREALLRAVLRADPATAFVPRRRRRGAWGNERMEVQLGHDSLARPDARALLVLEVHSVADRGGRRTHFATCALPCPVELLVEAGLGHVELPQVAWEDGQLLGTVQITYSGQVLQEKEQVLEGDVALDGLVELAFRGTILQKETAALVEEVELWNLKQRLDGGVAEDLVEPRTWLRQRLADLGVQRGEDLALLLPEDLRFPGVSDEDRRQLERHFPRRLNLGGSVAEVEYDVAHQTVTLIQQKGSLRRQPNLQLLPRWPGWRVLWRDHSRVTVLRE